MAEICMSMIGEQKVDRGNWLGRQHGKRSLLFVAVKSSYQTIVCRISSVLQRRISVRVVHVCRRV